MKSIKEHLHIIIFLIGLSIFIVVVLKYCDLGILTEKQETPKITEHPEHPEGFEHPEGSEHPEHPGDSQEQSDKLTVEELAEVVDEYIAWEAEMNEGYFLIVFKEQNTVLQLKLLKIHKERLAALGDNVYFVCADFKATDGNTYDIDIFMEGLNKDDLLPTQKMVHKVNGKPLFTWYEENGIWKQKEL